MPPATAPQLAMIVAFEASLEVNSLVLCLFDVQIKVQDGGEKEGHYEQVGRVEIWREISSAAEVDVHRGQ